MIAEVVWGTFEGALATAVIVLLGTTIYFGLAWREERKARRAERDESLEAIPAAVPDEWPPGPGWPDWDWPRSEDFPLYDEKEMSSA